MIAPNGPEKTRVWEGDRMRVDVGFLWRMEITYESKERCWRKRMWMTCMFGKKIKTEAKLRLLMQQNVFMAGVTKQHLLSFVSPFECCNFWENVCTHEWECPVKHSHTNSVTCYFAIFLYVNMACKNIFHFTFFFPYEWYKSFILFITIYCHDVTFSGTFGATLHTNSPLTESICKLLEQTEETVLLPLAWLDKRCPECSCAHHFHRKRIFV